MTTLKNAPINCYRQNLHAAMLIPDVEELNQIYQSSPAGSPPLLLVTRIAARQIMHPAIDHVTGDIADKTEESYRRCIESNADFAIDLIKAMRIMSGGIVLENLTIGNPYSFRDHSDGNSCRAQAADDTLVTGNIKV